MPISSGPCRTRSARRQLPSCWNRLRPVALEHPDFVFAEADVTYDDFKAHAESCYVLAQRAQSRADRALLLELADAWMELAKNARPQAPDPDIAGADLIDRYGNGGMLHQSEDR
jgi:hypothetical protein